MLNMVGLKDRGFMNNELGVLMVLFCLDPTVQGV